jgi:hypothetical protein
MGKLDVVDITCVQCPVARIYEGDKAVMEGFHVFLQIEHSNFVGPIHLLGETWASIQRRITFVLFAWLLSNFHLRGWSF